MIIVTTLALAVAGIASITLGTLSVFRYKGTLERVGDSRRY